MPQVETDDLAQQFISSRAVDKAAFASLRPPICQVVLQRDRLVNSRHEDAVSVLAMLLQMSPTSQQNSRLASRRDF